MVGEDESDGHGVRYLSHWPRRRSMTAGSTWERQWKREMTSPQLPPYRSVRSEQSVLQLHSRTLKRHGKPLAYLSTARLKRLVQVPQPPNLLPTAEHTSGRALHSQATHATMGKLEPRHGHGVEQNHCCVKRQPCTAANADLCRRRWWTAAQPMSALLRTRAVQPAGNHVVHRAVQHGLPAWTQFQLAAPVTAAWSAPWAEALPTAGQGKRRLGGRLFHEALT